MPVDDGDGVDVADEVGDGATVKEGVEDGDVDGLVLGVVLGLVLAEGEVVGVGKTVAGPPGEVEGETTVPLTVPEAPEDELDTKGTGIDPSVPDVPPMSIYTVPKVDGFVA